MELYVVCILVVIAISMLILKGVQLVISIVHPLPNEKDLHWHQNPQLPLDKSGKKPAKPGKVVKQKAKEPRGKRQPRSIRIEQLYSSSPLSFDELDSSFSRRSTAGGHHASRDATRTRTPSRYDDVQLLNTSGYGRETLQLTQPSIALEHLSFVEDDLDDPIEAYVQQQHQRILQEHQARASTPIQSHPQHQRQHSTKSHATIV